MYVYVTFEYMVTIFRVIIYQKKQDYWFFISWLVALLFNVVTSKQGKDMTLSQLKQPNEKVCFLEHDYASIVMKIINIMYLAKILIMYSHEG